MTGLTAEESKVIEVMQCDLDTARRALQEFRNDADQAIDALLMGTVSTLQASSSSLSPSGPAVSPSGDSLATPSHERQHSNTADGGWGTPPNDAAGPRRSERLDAKTRNSPIDLTNDEDEDFRKAMAASLESEKDRQKRHEEYGIDAQNSAARRSRSNVRGFRNGDFDLSSWQSLPARFQRTYGSKTATRGSRRMRASTAKKRRKETKKTQRQRQQEQDTEQDELQLVNEEDEALTRAIEASMLHSHQSTRAQSPQLSSSHLEALGANRIRAMEKPVAILAPSSFLQIFASALQALYASGPFRNALLRIRLADIRIQEADVANSMENFWRGASPSGIQRPSEEAWMSKNFPVDVERDAIDCLMRLSTLFTFMTYTKRTLVVAEDVIAHSSMRNYAYTMNSERQSATNYILSCYVQTVLDKLSELGDGLEKTSKDICDSTSFKRSFQSCAIGATDPQKEQISTRTRFLRKESYDTVVNSLTQTSLYNTVHRALYRCLADENVLFSEVADTLFFTVGRDSPTNSLASRPTSNSQQADPFTLETRIYLDAFMSARRNGVRLGLDTEEVAERQKRIDELEQYRKSITTFQGDDARTMLKASKEYFETLYDDYEGDGEVADEADQVRIVSVKEAHERLGVILQHLEQEISDVEQEIQEGKQAIEDVQQTILASFERDLQEKEFQTMPYDLQAVLMEDANGNEERETWAYVRHGGYGSFDDQDHFDEQSRKEARWWRIRNGEVTAVDEDVVTSDPSSITFLVYTASRTKETGDDAKGASDGGIDTSAASGPDTRMEDSGQDKPDMDGSKPTKTIRLDSGPDWWAKQPLVEAIEYDNASFGRQLAEELRAANETLTDNVADRTAMIGD